MSSRSAFAAVPLTETVIEHTFTETTGTPLASSTPDKVTGTSTWIVGGDGDGTWDIDSGGRARIEADTGGLDNRAVIDATISDGSVSLELTPLSGKSGVVARYLDSDNWLMAWYDDDAGELHLGQSVGGSLTTLATTTLAWSNGEVLKLSFIGTAIEVYADGALELSATASGTLSSNTFVGLFANMAELATNRYDEFTVETRELIADAGPDQFVDDGEVVTLTGADSESFSLSDTSLTFAWVQLSGQSVTLSASSSTSTDFTAPSVTSTEELIFQLSVTDLNGTLSDTVSIFVQVASAAPSGTTAISDSFSESGVLDLANHPANVSTSTWSSIAGTWEVDAVDGEASEASGSASIDHRAVIDSLISDGTVSAVVTFNGGKVGLVTRYADESNWIMAWLNGSDRLFLAQRFTVGTSTQFSTLGVKTGLSVSTGTPFTLAIRSVGEEITVFIDGVEQLSGTASASLSTSTKVGLFSRSTATNSFDSFLVSTLPLTVDAGGDQDIVIPATVVMDGSASTSSDLTDSNIIYEWTQTAGSETPALTGTTTSIASFTAPSVTSTVVLTFQLEVTDGSGSTSTTVDITIRSSISAGTGTTAVLDSFTDLTDSDLEVHSPETDGSGWSAVQASNRSDWKITASNEASEASADGAVDHRAVIESSISDGTVSADVTFNGGKVGLVTRYTDESNWIMAWLNGSNRLFLGQRITVGTSTQFSTLGVKRGGPGILNSGISGIAA